MASFEPDLLLLLIGLAAIVLTLSIVAAVLYLWKMLRKEVRWPGLQNPYGWPVDMLGDLDAHTVDKSVCKKRLRPSRIEKSAKKFHKTLGDVLPEAEPPPVPTRVDSLTNSDRRTFELAERQAAKATEKLTGVVASAPQSGPSAATKRQPVERKGQSCSGALAPSTSNASASDESVKLRRERKRATSGYRDEKRRPSKTSFRDENIATIGQHTQPPAQQQSQYRPQRHKECTIDISEDNEPPPPYSEVRRYP